MPTTAEHSCPTLTPLEAQQVQNCLALLERAQNLIDEAAQQLCPVRGFGDEWSALGEPHATVKAHWHLVDSRRQQIQIEGLRTT